MSQDRKHGSETHNDEVKVEETPTKTDEQRATDAKRDAEIDGLLDEIDDVLEENAEDFVKGYVQKGGQ